MGRQRIDRYLVACGLAPSRERARALVLAGAVRVNRRRVDKPGSPVRPGDRVEVRGGEPYVSRGGRKLEAALDCFGVEVEGKTVLDVGASTGGFTDCLLQRGAARVWAVDVGYGQLAWSLRTDPRVTVLERTNIRHVRPEEIPVRFDLATVDVSFISLRLVLPVVRRLLAPGADVVALVKPQFEAGRGRVGKGGVVRDPEVQREAVETVARAAAGVGLGRRGAVASPLLGPKGNREFFLHLTAEPGG